MKTRKVKLSYTEKEKINKTISVKEIVKQSVEGERGRGWSGAGVGVEFIWVELEVSVC